MHQIFYLLFVLSYLPTLSAEALLTQVSHCSNCPRACDISGLKTTIHAIPKGNPHSSKGHVQPGTTIQLQAAVKNAGTASSKEGALHIQFAFPEPLNDRKDSTIFETERVALPSIAPGEEVLVIFDKMHRWPNFFDFIRDDWAMREYQAIAIIGGHAQTIGTLTIAFSAYYYEGAH
ncbi:putative uncharacterized protein [Waddlia chondrophila 2032/99]|nr:hypothetical protein [Waddlia chondrophila]CCB90511.1 putative uncharacterized protein [Waddlia chondrophila 2032/99]